MLRLVLGLFDIIKNIGYYSIVLSYKTGQMIVHGLIASCEVINKLFTTIWTVLVILNEDLYIFLHDVCERLGFLVHAIAVCVEFISDSILGLVNLCRFLVFGTSDLLIMTTRTMIDVVTKVTVTIGSVISGTKHVLVLFGSGVWFAVTLVPVFIVYLCMLSAYYLGRTIDELCSAIHSIYSTTKTGMHDLISFVTDVPFESLAGLVACCCLTYVLIKFHIALYSILTRLITQAKDTISQYVSTLMQSIRTRETARNSGSSSELSDVEETNVRRKHEDGLDLDSRLCIICLERSKCILAMPCRHMCTCVQCYETLKNYQRTCPICRRYVNYTIEVY